MTLRILVPLDGSDRSFRALETGLLRLAGAPGLSVTLFTVVHKGFEGAGEDAIARFDEDEQDEIFPTEESARRMLERARQACAKLGVPAVERVVVGSYYDEILRESAQHDLLLMHRLDPGEVREKLRGSRTERLARNARTSVLLVDA
ncbi:MAG TPA: universal stress protein [Candidatus Thermoplasmatota archaeon]|nr:universal stress protein [Candidatus Thermoplasmatota archaeon]